MKKLFVVALLFFVASSFPAQAQYDAVVSLRPAGPQSCIAVEIPTPGGLGLAGLRWFHNDSQQPFPRLVLLEGQPASPPDLNDASLILQDISGQSLAWGEVSFGGPVTSSTGTAYAVFYFPESVETQSLGEGGGPGLGIRVAEESVPFYLTGDGASWVKFADGYELGVEPVFVAMKGEPRVLADMRAELVEGEENEPPTPARTAFGHPKPNPFNPRVELSYTLAKASHVELVVYDVMGRAVRTLVAETLPPGEYTRIWAGTDEDGHAVSSGVYFAKFRADGVQQSQRMVLIR